MGGDTIFSSGAAVYSSLSPYFQKYLESLSAVHSGHEQAKGARSAGQHVRREPIETVHPLVRVHPVTGIKSVFFNAGFARRIVGVPKAESDNVMRFLNEQFAVNHDFTWRVKWEKDDVVIWDVSRLSSHVLTCSHARTDLNLHSEPSGQPLCPLRLLARTSSRRPCHSSRRAPGIRRIVRSANGVEGQGLGRRAIQGVGCGEAFSGRWCWQEGAWIQGLEWRRGSLQPGTTMDTSRWTVRDWIAIVAKSERFNPLYIDRCTQRANPSCECIVQVLKSLMSVWKLQ